MRFPTPILMAAIAGWSASPLRSQAPPRQYVAPRLAATPVIDGRIDEPAWDAASWSADFVDIEGDRRPRPALRTRMRIGWDDRALYIAAALEEPNLWATLLEHDSVIFHDNDFEWFIDPDGDTERYFEFEINALGTGWDLFLDRPYRHGGRPDNGWSIRGLRAVVRRDGTLNEPRDTDRGWTVEMAIPWAAFRRGGAALPPAPGSSWRINFSRVEWDLAVVDSAGRPRYAPQVDPRGKRLPEHNWVWSPQGEVNMHIPERWGTVTFAGAPALDAATPRARSRD